MDRKKHTIDKALARTGVVLTYDGAKFTIASNTTTAWTKAMQKHRRGHSQQLLDKDTALDRDCTLKAVAEAMLITWEGVTDDGKPLEPTYENKLALLRDCPGFTDWVLDQARNLGNFGLEADATDEAAVKSEA